jgi:hypothetical protein
MLRATCRVVKLSTRLLAAPKRGIIRPMEPPLRRSPYRDGACPQVPQDSSGAAVVLGRDAVVVMVILWIVSSLARWSDTVDAVAAFVMGFPPSH